MATAGGVPVLERPDLRARIGSALDAGSLLLTADAGFGKTTALRDALDTTGPPPPGCAAGTPTAMPGGCSR